MTRITLNLEDDEFLELGGLGFSIDTWNVDPKKHSFGRLALKIKEQVQKKATPGQLLHFEKVVQAIMQAAATHEVGVMMAKDGMTELVEAAETIFDTLKDGN